MRIVSIDPGKWNAPAALWQDSRLVGCAMSALLPTPRRPVDSIAHGHYTQLAQALYLGLKPIDAVYIEQLSLNSGRDSTRGKALSTGNALLEITSIAALIAGSMGGRVHYLPVRTWLGTAPPAVTKARVLATLDSEELKLVSACLAKHKKSIHHNVFDALGLGLYATGRYRPGRKAG